MLFDVYKTKNNISTIYLMFALINLTDVCKYMHILNLMLPTSWTGKVEGMNQKRKFI